MDTSIFKAYDIRGVYPEEINEEIIYKIAQSYVELIKPKQVVLGRDVRESGQSLWEVAAKGFIDAGVDVIDIGIVSTDMMYFATAYLKTDGGISITASHNPREYNGMKLVRAEAVPISGDSGINDMRDMVVKGIELKSENKGSIEKKDITKA